ncbi:hypothetical protein HZC00_04535 [Candidatus Kaiserbacteria bacterium]|nr:hypothetical protein [Candidatus Kaiserbacteria bacterium]
MSDTLNSVDEGVRSSLLVGMDEKSQQLWKGALAAVATEKGRNENVLMQICEEMHLAVGSLIKNEPEPPVTVHEPNFENIVIFLEVVDGARKAHTEASHPLQGVTTDKFQVWVSGIKEKHAVFLPLLLPKKPSPPKAKKGK